MTSDAPRPRSARVRNPRRRWIIIGVLVVALLWTAIAGYQVVQARRHAQDGLDRLRAAQDQLDAAELIRGKGIGKMRAAQREFDAAASSADSPFVTPFVVLPVVGRQVRSVRALANGASTVVRVGVDTMEKSSKELDRTASTGADRVELLGRLGGIGGAAATSLDEVGLGPDEALIGPLASARKKFARQLHKAQRAMRDVRDAADGIGQMAQGPSKYLLLAANNSEMRAGSGMLLSAGVLTVDQGNFDLGEMTSVNDLMLPPGAVPLGGDYGKVWGWLQPTEEWRYLAMSPQFDVTGALAAQMWKAKTGEEVDGVLALDPIALKALVKVSGPVEVDGTRIDEDNIVRQILLQQYIDSGLSNADPEDDLPQNAARRERNGAIARAIVDRLDEVGWKIADLVDDLRAAARGRHVLFWSSKPAQQRAWKAAGVSGILPKDALMVSVANRAGNKLDQFLPVRAAITHRPVAIGSEVTVKIDIANLAPEGLPRYVAGPYPYSDFIEGEYRGILAVTIPLVSRDIHLDGVEKLVAAGRDQTTRVVAGDMRLLRGETGTYTLRFTVPRGYERLDVVPSARYPAVTYTDDGHEWNDDDPRRLAW